MYFNPFPFNDGLPAKIHRDELLHKRGVASAPDVQAHVLYGPAIDGDDGEIGVMPAIANQARVFVVPIRVFALAVPVCFVGGVDDVHHDGEHLRGEAVEVGDDGQLGVGFAVNA
ncbi:hypothetical protein Trco_006001 [Trichoderma cornu-damae]|uniref:Uncharacterized protein n=1 Tax=Trichoderma cornu-damae TaxID=654480 RepID=A0A9P8TVX5_9HYPO|nr:hypothetical protein Trco_006001 [Trichoderma cornu-damae]